MNAMLRSAALPTLFIPHGGGPCFFMEWNPPDTWKRMGDWLRSVADSIGIKPDAVVVISGHWEAREFTVNTGSQPPLLFDYYGFPPHTYELTYPAPGSPELAERIRGLLADAGIASGTDSQRGFDHGVFVPFKLIYPDAGVPIVQLSLKEGLDPAAHLAMGRALAPLRHEKVLLIGSGMSYHNLRGFGPAFTAASREFDSWLTETVTASPEEREARLLHWQKAPAGTIAHPDPDHLLPLMVVTGAAGKDTGRRIFTDEVMGVAVSAYQFG
jgi:aromatic ring-opening dioxygenase catalytic subunit (LigB family)